MRRDKVENLIAQRLQAERTWRRKDFDMLQLKLIEEYARLVKRIERLERPGCETCGCSCGGES